MKQLWPVPDAPAPKKPTYLSDLQPGEFFRFVYDNGEAGWWLTISVSPTKTVVVGAGTTFVVAEERQSAELEVVRMKNVAVVLLDDAE